MTLHGPPEIVGSDIWSEFFADAAHSVLVAACVNSIPIVPGAPWQNPIAETFHALSRNEPLNHELVTTGFEASVLIGKWRFE